MKNRVNILILILWFALALTGLLYHEIWRDEAQVWCLVRDLGFIDLLKATRIEGHPILWYLLILPFAKLGFPVETMSYISFALTLCAVAFMLWKSPFSLLEKILVSFSAGMVYFIPVIARNYALIPLAVFLLAYFYPMRSIKPYKYAFLLILLSQTHVLMFAFSGLLFIFFACENLKERKHLVAIILPALNFLILLCTFCLAGTENYVVKVYSHKTNDLFSLVYNFCYYYFKPLFTGSMLLNLIIFYGSILLIGVSLFKQDKKLFSLFFVSFAYIFFIFAKIWFGGITYQKSFILLLIVIFCYWVSNKNYKLFKIAFIVMFLVSSLLSLPVIGDEIKYQFSGAKQLSAYIKENLSDKEFMFLGYSMTISPISAYLPDRLFYSTEQDKFVTYYDFRELPNLNIIKAPDTDYFIVQNSSYLFEEMGFDLIYATSEEIIGPTRQAEIYKLYKRKKL